MASLRLGYLVADAASVPEQLSAKRLSCLGSAALNELVLSEFVDRGYYDTHPTRMQQAVEERYRHCVAWLRQHMPADAKFSLPGGGLALWFEPPPGTDLLTLSGYCQSRGVQLHNADTFFYGPRQLQGFRIRYAADSAVEMRRGLSVLRDGLTQQNLAP